MACEYWQPSQVLFVAPVAVVRQDLEADLAIMRESAMKLQMSMGTAIAQALWLSLVQRLQHCCQLGFASRCKLRCKLHAARRALCTKV